MKSFTVLLTFTLSLVLVITAYRLESDKAVRKQLIDYLRETDLENLIHQQRMELRKHLQQYEDNLSAEDQSDDNADTKMTYTRRKAVGLGDNPFK